LVLLILLHEEEEEEEEEAVLPESIIDEPRIAVAVVANMMDVCTIYRR
jgi:hypothetical protein